VGLGLDAVAVETAVELRAEGDEQVDRVMAAIAELGLPLYRFGPRVTSLDDVFLERAVR
jgi:hypothetical protein